MTPSVRERLGEHVRARRRQLGLSVSDAARDAEVNRMTWDALERGTRATRDSNYAGIEHALQWAPGSVERILEGGEPHPLQEHDTSATAPPKVNPYVDPTTGEEYTDPKERELWSLDTFDMDDRRKMIYFIRGERLRQQAEQRRRRAS